jgi:hypothetical protein
MTATDPITAVFRLWDLFAAPKWGPGVTEFPPLFLGEAAQTKPDASQQRVPYGVLYDDGLEPTYDSSFGGTEGGTFRLELFALKLDAASGISVGSMVRCVRWGNAPPAEKRGFDFATLPLHTDGCFYPVSLKLTKEQRAYAGFTTKGPNGESARVHKAILTYRLVVGLNASKSPAVPTV